MVPGMKKRLFRPAWLMVGAISAVTFLTYGQDPNTATAANHTPWFGVLQPNEERAHSTRNAGISVASLEIGWDAWAPTKGNTSPAYVDQVKRKYNALNEAGYEIILDAGLQYPPS